MTIIIMVILIAVAVMSGVVATKAGDTSTVGDVPGTVPTDASPDSILPQDLFGGLTSWLSGSPNTSSVPILSFGGNVSAVTTNGQYDSFIRTQATQFNLDPVLVKAVIDRESTFRPDAISYIFDRTTLAKRSDISTATAKQHIQNDDDGGANFLKSNNIDCSLGLMQVRASYVGNLISGTPVDLFEPSTGIFCGCTMIQQLVNSGVTMPDGIDAYNMGIGNYRKGKRNIAYRDYVLSKMKVYAGDFA